MCWLLSTRIGRTRKVENIGSVGFRMHLKLSSTNGVIIRTRKVENTNAVDLRINPKLYLLKKLLSLEFDLKYYEDNFCVT